jgi:uncharacterized iron-regulated membrane protein
MSWWHRSATQTRPRLLTRNIRRGVMKAAIVAAIIGGTLAVVEGLLLIVLGSLAGLAENPEERRH